MKMKYFVAVIFGVLAAYRGTLAAKVKSLEAIVGDALQKSIFSRPTGPLRLTEEQIQYMLAQSREGGNGKSRIEIRRIRRPDPVTGEEFDDVFVNETWSDPDEENGRDICHHEGDFTPSAALIQTAKKLLDSDYGSLMSVAIAAYVDLAEYLGRELYHMEAKVGGPEPVEDADPEVITLKSANWVKELNEVLAVKGWAACANTAERLLTCMKKTTCLLEEAVNSNPQVFTAGRMATYLEVEKEVHDHFTEFAIEAHMGVPMMPELCDGEDPSVIRPSSLVQLKSEIEAHSETSARRSNAVAAVMHMQRATKRTVTALSDHSKLGELEASFFTHTWKKTCEMIGCNVESFADIMDASVGHTAELVEVEASFHAVKTQHQSFRQFKTSVFSALNGSSTFHQNFTSFLYQPGKSRGQRRTDPIFREASDVLSTALALKTGGDDNDGKGIKKSGWWCWSWRVIANGGYAKKFPDKSSTWGVATGIKLLRGLLVDFTPLLKGEMPPAELVTSIGLTIGYVPDWPGTAGVRVGISVGGKLTLAYKKVEFGISLGLGTSAALDAKLSRPDWCGGPASLGSGYWEFKCRGSVAASFTLFCKKFNFLNGKNGASLDDPCSTWNKFYKQNNGDEDMPGQGRSVEDSADHCRERCKGVKHCRHYSFWPNGGCHLQNLDSKMHWEGGSDIKTGPPICCARASTGIDKDMNGQGRSGEPEYEDCLNRCKSVKGCRYFTYWGKDGGCHLGDKYANLQQNDKQGGRVVTADAYCLGSELRHGNVIALHNKDHNRFIRMNDGFGVDASGEKNVDELPGDWKWEKFTVVDANFGQVALHNAVHKRFLKMKDDGTMTVSEERDVDDLPDSSLLRFTPVEAGSNMYAFHNQEHGRFIRMAANRVVDCSGKKGKDNLPDNWTWERFEIVDL